MATYTGQSPGAAQYGMFAAQAQQALQNAQARIQRQRGQFLQQQGLEGIYGADGKMTDFRVGAGQGSQFGGYQQMMRGLGQQGDQLDAGLGAVGFKGGLAQQARDEQGQENAATTSAFGQQTLQGISDLAGADQQNNQDYNNSLFQQFQGQVRDAISNGTFNPADYSGIQIPGYDNPYKSTPASGGGITPTGTWKPPVAGSGKGPGLPVTQTQNYKRWVAMGKPGGTYKRYLSNHGG